jgi:hypothetical protein
MVAHSCDVGVGFPQDTLHILEFNVVSGGSLAFNCRDCFCCAAKIDFEGGTIEVLCLHYFVYKVDNHTGGSDQWETKNRVHAHLGPGGHDKRGCTSVLGEIRQMKLKGDG